MRTTPLQQQPRRAFKTVHSLQHQAGAALANILLLLVLIAVGAAGWFGWHALEEITATDDALREEIIALRSGQTALGAEKATELAALNKRVDQTEIELASRAETLANLQNGGQRNWLLNEAEALANLAQERILLTADIMAAQRLLKAADKTLARINDSRVLPARKAVAADLDALSSAEQVDVQALILKLGVLQQRITLMALPVTAKTEQREDKTSPPPEAGWWDRFVYSLPVNVRHQQAPLPLPLDAQQASTLRLYLDNNLQQAQLSLLQSKPQSYRQAIQQAQRALNTWLVEDNSEVKHVKASLQALLDANVEQALPEIGKGIAAIRGLQAEFNQ